MLFLTKKTMVSVLALGTLLSVTPQVRAEYPVREVVGLSAAIATGKLAHVLATHKVDHTKKDKDALTRVKDTAAGTVQSVLNLATSKEGLAALALGALAYAGVVHGKNVKNLPAVQWILSQVTPKP